MNVVKLCQIELIFHVKLKRSYSIRSRSSLRLDIPNGKSETSDEPSVDLFEYFESWYDNLKYG